MVNRLRICSPCLKDLAKRKFLAEAALEQRLDFVVLSETGRDNFAP